MNTNLEHYTIDLRRLEEVRLGHVRLFTWVHGTFTALSLFSLMLVGAYYAHVEEATKAVAASVVYTQELKKALSVPTLEAKAAVLYDAKTGEILYEKNATAVLPLASLTKLMTAEALLRSVPEDSSVVVSEEALRAEGDSGLHAGETWSLKSLLTLGLVESSNDAMAAAAQSAGTSSIVAGMNELAQTLGLTTLHFKNPTGLDLSATEAGSYGSAHDIALLAADFLKRYPELFATTVTPKTSVPKSNDATVDARPTSEPILNIPGLIGAKTGYTDLAGGNLVVAFDLELGHPVIAVVLGSSREGRFTDIRTLVDAVRAASHQ